MRCLAGVAAVLLLAGCSAAGGTGGRSGAASGSGSERVVVLAAASLAGPMATLARQYEQAHPGARVTVSTGGSSDLVAQLAGGLRADVLATADERTMSKAVADHTVEAPVRIATNTLTLVTAPGNPLHLTSLADAAAHTLVVCAPQVPCGAATRTLAGGAVKARSEEQNVTAVLEKVTSGQADAGVVYVTDARRAGAKVTAVDLPGAAAVVNTQMAALTPAASPAGRGFYAQLVGAPGRAALSAAGFGAP